MDWRKVNIAAIQAKNMEIISPLRCLAIGDCKTPNQLKHQEWRWKVNEPDGYTREIISTEILNRRGRGLLTPEGRPHGRTMSEHPEISNEETTVVRLLASDADTVGADGVGSVPDRRRVGLKNARSPFTTGRDATLAVDL